MCGIAAWVDFQKDLSNEGSSIKRMTETLSKRGPDDTNYFFAKHVAFGHKRLAIVDLLGGRQPMKKQFKGKTYTLIYNGELYNTEDIRKELLKLGHQFSGHSDTEVLLDAYIEWKEDCLKHLNGIFAFAVWDEEEEKLFAARDRLGVKPLFYRRKNGSLMIGSEIKAILAHPEVKAKVGLDGLCEVFALGPSHTPGHGVFKDIQELRPAHAMTFSRNGLKIWRYWQVKSLKHEESLEETIEQVRYLVEDAVTRQLVSDVPVCTFLSGGIDSSTISAIASLQFASEKKSPLHTFSIDYEGNETFFKASDFQPDSDKTFIEKISDTFHTIHHSCIISNETLIQHLTEAVILRDLPGMADIDSSLLWFCREIRKDFVVSLSGECADEIFGGYPWFHRKHTESLESFPWIRSLHAREELLKDGWREKLKIREYILERYKETVAETPILEEETEEEKKLRQLFYLNMIWFMSTLLERKDRMSMGASLEVRVPFADHRLVEYVWNIPWDMKNAGGREKGILRKAMEHLLPPEVLYRKKSPYPKTHNPGYRKGVTLWVKDILKDRTSPLYEFFQSEHLENLVLSGGNSINVPWFGQLMTGPQLIAYLGQIHVWFKEYNLDIID